jgi:hypothetical protein
MLLEESVEPKGNKQENHENTKTHEGHEKEFDKGEAKARNSWSRVTERSSN